MSLQNELPGSGSISLGHEMFMLPHGTTCENADWWYCNRATFKTAEHTHPTRGHITIVSLDIKCRN